MYRSQICDALNRRRLLRFLYKDHPTHTTVEPYTYGKNKAGHFTLSAWLVSGETHDPKPPLWRLYREDEMHAVEVLKDEFAKDRPGYKPSDSRFAVILCKLASPGA
jgi:hypothetical protein